MVGPDDCGLGTVKSLASVSITTPFTSRIFMSTRTGPSGASNDAWLGTPGDPGSPVGPTGPAKRTVPSGFGALLHTVAARGFWVVAVTVGAKVAEGVHVTITRARPVSAGVTPDHD